MERQINPGTRFNITGHMIKPVSVHNKEPMHSQRQKQKVSAHVLAANQKA